MKQKYNQNKNVASSICKNMQQQKFPQKFFNMEFTSTYGMLTQNILARTGQLEKGLAEWSQEIHTLRVRVYGGVAKDQDEHPQTLNGGRGVWEASQQKLDGPEQLNNWKEMSSCTVVIYCCI